MYANVHATGQWPQINLDLKSLLIDGFFLKSKLNQSIDFELFYAFSFFLQFLPKK
jgi:hypothetical protein